MATKDATEATPLTQGGPSSWRQSREAKTVAACALFMVTSATMLVVNKRVVTHFHTPMLVVLVQNSFAVMVCVTYWYKTLHYGSRADALRFAKAVPIFYACMLCTSAVAQQYASLGMQIVIRNLGPLLSFPIERCFNEPLQQDAWTWASLLTVLLGVCLYVDESLALTPYEVKHAKRQDPDHLAAGILLMVANMLFAIVERLYQRKLLAITPVDVSKTGMILLNNAVSLIPISALIYPIDFRTQEYGTSYWHAPNCEWYDYVLLAVSALCGVAIGWTSLNAQQYVSATTMLLITNLNKVVVIVYGMIFLPEPDGPFAICGVLVAMGGGVWYALARQNLAKKSKAEKEALKAKLVDEEKGGSKQ